MNRITPYTTCYSGDLPPEGPESDSTPRLADPYDHRSSRRSGPRGARGLLSGLWGGMGVLFDSGAVITLTCGFLACWWVLWFIAGHAIKTAWGM